MFSFLSKLKSNPKKKLKKTLGDYELPSFPATVMKALQKIRHPDSSATSISEVLSVDPGLSVRVLSIANSAEFSPSKKVENLAQAVALVGLSQLESLVLAVGVSKAMPPDPAPGYDMKQFWKSSARRGVLAHRISSITNPTRKPECFTAGFLQDMALPFLVKKYPVQYLEIIQRWQNENADLCTLEHEAFGWDHAEVATWICHEWDLPETIASAIGAHHGEHLDIYDDLPPVSMVALMNDKAAEPGINALIEKAHTQHGIEPNRMQEIIETSFDAAEDLARLIA